MEHSAIGSREKRLKLADAFDKAAGIPIVVEPKAKRVWPPKREDKREPPSVAQGDSQAPQAPAAATITRGVGSTNEMAWLAALAVAVLGLALFLFMRSRRGQ